MENISSIFSLLFFLAAIVSLFWGLHLVRLNSESNINRLFLSICVALSIWSFGFAMANSQSSMEAALFWRRFSAVGWTSIFGIILHFFLFLTKEEGDTKFNKALFLIHIPSLINMYIFAFSDNMAKIQYNLVEIEYGWTNIAVNNGWDYYYYFYYTVYMAISTVAVWKWAGKRKKGIQTRQAKFILVAIFLAALSGGLIDLASNSLLISPLPQMGPLFTLLPVGMMYHAAKYHDILNIKKINKEEIFISSEQQKVLFKNLAVAICLGGVLASAFEYISKNSGNTGDLTASLLKGGILIGLGLSIFFIQRVKKEELRKKLTTVILVISIPVVTLQFLEYSSITVWAYSIIIIISSLLFEKRTLLISTAIVAIITQRLVWIFKEESYVLVDQYDFILRIMLLVIALLLGFYINNIYIAKIKESNNQIKFQKLVSDVALDLVGFNLDNSYGKLNSFLEKVGKFYSGDRTYIFTINYSNETMTYSNEWCNVDIGKEEGTIDEIPLDIFPWWLEQFRINKRVFIEDVDSMPDEARSEQEQLQRQKVKSLLSVPVLRDNKIHAFIGIDSVTKNKHWSKKDIELLHILANILSNVLTPTQIDQETKFRAYHDSLTRLPNRFLFTDRVTNAINSFEKDDPGFGIIFLDLDGFKLVNDTLGHRGGDSLLKHVAKRLSESVRKTDTVARFAGDEFIIMVNNITNYDQVSKIADNVMGVFSESFIVGEQEFLISASAGVALFPADGDNVDDLIMNADIAMYKAKTEGKNQYAISTEEMKKETQIKIELSNDIAKALKRNEFTVYYQPQVDLTTNKIIGLEALVRWMHPTRGIILPGVFIPIAEKTNLINDIGEWVLKTACLQIKKWQDMGLPHLNLAVNLSAVQIMNPNLIENVENIFKETGVDSKYMCLEITENIAIKETGYVLDVLNKLRELGVAIAIDDFGTKYSSLTRLKMLPVDIIKIDMQFVQGIESNEKDRAIIMGTINLADKLGINVLAEGVETAEQLEFLIENQCDYAQGFYYYKPMAAKKMEKILIKVGAGSLKR